MSFPPLLATFVLPAKTKVNGKFCWTLPKIAAIVCGMEQLKAYLLEKNIRPAHFAASLGVARGMVKNWLDGVHVPADRYKKAIHQQTNGDVPVSAWFDVE
jgi:hypothetical protein